MTLHQFLDRTATISDREVRPALALALTIDIPRSREDYARFYRRVMGYLDEAHRCGVTLRDNARPTRTQERCDTACVSA